MLSASTLIRQIRNEYQSMPGLKLTREQACRLWSVDEVTCATVLEMLTEEGFLHRTGTGKFIALPRRAGLPLDVTTTSTRSVPVRCPHCQKLNTMERREGNVAGLGSFRCVACHRLVSFTAIRA